MEVCAIQLPQLLEAEGIMGVHVQSSSCGGATELGLDRFITPRSLYSLGGPGMPEGMCRDVSVENLPGMTLDLIGHVESGMAGFPPGDLVSMR